MNILLMSAAGDGCGVGLQLRGEGHNVGVWIRESTSKRNYEGLLTKVERWESFLQNDTLVLFDTSGGGKTADRLASQGRHVLGSSLLADELEQDRGLAIALMEEAGIKVPQTKTFTSWKRARTFVEGEKEVRWVFKPSTDLGPLVQSFVPDDNDELLLMLEYFEKVATPKKEGTEFILQEFKEGVALSSEGWFNGEEFIRPFNQTLEKKAMGNENLGPSCGCSGNIVWRVDGDNKIINEGIALMEPYLREQSYLGPLDLNAVVNAEGVWGLEFTPRFGYDATPTLFQTLLDTKLGEFLVSVARKDRPREMPLRTGFGSSVHLSIPPYPSDKFHAAEGVPIRGWVRDDRPLLYFFDVLLNDDNQLVSSPAYGNICMCLGYGETISEAVGASYRLAERGKVPDKQYRTDLESVLTRDFEKVQEYLKGGKDAGSQSVLASDSLDSK